MKKLVLLIFVFLLCSVTYSQYYSTGQDRSSISWREIETDDFQLVYPSYFENQAQRLAAIFTELYHLNKKSLKVQPKKVSIVLHAETTKSNGYFAWAPRRGELYSTPPNAGLPNDWLEHLATHEYRHVVQMDKLHEDLPKILTVLFGEQAVPAVLSYKVPMWFMEGDAVLSETLLSNAGRGRSPKFLQVMKAHLLENENWYSYDKASLGSFKDYVPNYYEFGYFMVANTLKNYGDDFWINALAKAGEYPYPWYNFAEFSLKNEERKRTFQKLIQELDSHAETESTFDSKELEIAEKWNNNAHKNATVTLYNDNMTELQARWKQEQSLIDTTTYQPLSKSVKIYTNYTSPQILNDGSIAVLKSGYEDYLQFVNLKNDGTEEVLFTPGNLTSKINVNDEFLYWTEDIPHIRWTENSHSALYYLDVISKKKRKIPFDRDLYMPSANEDNSLIVAVVKNDDYTNELVVLDRETGELKYQYNFGSTRITDPQFINSSTIAYIFTEDGTGIAELNLKTKEKDLLVEIFNVALSDLEYSDGSLLFTAGYEGKNDIYKLEMDTSKLIKLTESPYGASEATISGDKLVYVSYTSKGNQVVSMDLEEGENIEVEPKAWNDDLLLQAVNHQQKEAELSYDKSLAFSSNHYSKSKKLFNFHSRSPFAFSSGDYDLGISTTSQNLLSTMFVNVGYRDKSGYKNGQAYANLVYKGWFPIISTELSYGKQSRRLLTILDNQNPIDTATIKQEKRRWEWETEVSLPFDISRGKYSRHITVSTGLEFTKDRKVKHTYLSGTSDISSYKEGDPIHLGLEKTHKLLKYNFVFSNLHKRSYRDLYSPFGQQLSFTYRHTPFDDDNAYTYAAEGVFYFPSLIKHHGIKLYGAYQYQPEQNEFLDDNIEHPRGTSSLLSEKKYTLMSNYKFPLAYPDWNLGRVLYVKRVNTALFYDYGLSKTEDYSKNIHSFGTEFTADAHILHIPIPIVFGVRVGYETQTSDMFYDALLSIRF
ncbi:hypothetical protein C7377_0889 [Balneicella halophila]|uniref:WD40 repeat protein n=1 Tax=Balneicella halophila TaxID=1537566 RepID=A0A7L4USQ4_BALHA|nr:hypothetical protein [Balneicella halophila]PVX52562.1 hypothetical protein C7377_0889 [Balneicella halophila]